MRPALRILLIASFAAFLWPQTPQENLTRIDRVRERLNDHELKVEAKLADIRSDVRSIKETVDRFMWAGSVLLIGLGGMMMKDFYHWLRPGRAES